MDYQPFDRCPINVQLTTRHVSFVPKCPGRKPLVLAFAARVTLLLIVGVLPVVCAAVAPELDPSFEPPGDRCRGDRNFRIAMDYTWEPEFSVAVEQDGPGFRPLLCVAHGPDFELWSAGKENSPTINSLLQTGNFSSIVGEIKGNMTLGNVRSFNISNSRVFRSPAVDFANVTVSPSVNATLISCIAGITPSPDWFTGISNLEMCEFNATTRSYSYPADGKVINLRTFDAEYNDLEIPQGESELLERPRPVTLKVNLGERIGIAQVAVLGRATVPSQTARGGPERENVPECFPGSASVETDDGSKVLMRDLVETQRIRSATDAFSEVFMFSHHDPHVWTQFITVRFGDESANKTGTLTATRGHYVYVYDEARGEARTRLTAMDTVRNGDRFVSALGRSLRVFGVSTTWEKGLYNPHTIDGDLVVDGVLVSSFTRAIAPEAAKRAMRPLRMLYSCGWSRLVHLCTRWVLSGRFNAVLARLLPRGS